MKESVGYTGKEWEAHLTSTLPGGVRVEGVRYHIDHVFPLHLIDDMFPEDSPDRPIAYRMVMDLDNIRLIPAIENQKKLGALDLDRFPEQEQAITHLCEKYGITDEMLKIIFPA